MAENPLLPHRKLREMHALMLRCRVLLGKAGSAGREALLVATSMHLQPGDLLCETFRDNAKAFAELAPPSRGGVVSGGLAKIPSEEQPLPIASAIARGLLSDEPDRTQAVALVFVSADARSPGWQRALASSQSETLPLLMIAIDKGAQSSAGKRSHADVPAWLAVSRLAKKLELPVVAVDGEDAVAVYRVMQESVVRARQGGGPAIVWAIFGSTHHHRAVNPIQRLRRYMKVRGITF